MVVGDGDGVLVVLLVDVAVEAVPVEAPDVAVVVDAVVATGPEESDAAADVVEVVADADLKQQQQL